MAGIGPAIRATGITGGSKLGAKPGNLNANKNISKLSAANIVSKEKSLEDPEAQADEAEIATEENQNGAETTEQVSSEEAAEKATRPIDKLRTWMDEMTERIQENDKNFKSKADEVAGIAQMQQQAKAAEEAAKNQALMSKLNQPKPQSQKSSGGASRGGSSKKSSGSGGSSSAAKKQVADMKNKATKAVTDMKEQRDKALAALKKEKEKTAKEDTEKKINEAAKKLTDENKTKPEDNRETDAATKKDNKRTDEAATAEDTSHIESTRTDNGTSTSTVKEKKPLIASTTGNTFNTTNLITFSADLDNAKAFFNPNSTEGKNFINQLTSFSETVNDPKVTGMIDEFKQQVSSSSSLDNNNALGSNTNNPNQADDLGDFDPNTFSINSFASKEPEPTPEPELEPPVNNNLDDILEEDQQTA